MTAQTLRLALVMGMSGSRDEQSELARAFGHPIPDRLKKITAAKGPVSYDEDPRHRDYLQVGSATELSTPKPPVSPLASPPANGGGSLCGVRCGRSRGP